MRILVLGCEGAGLHLVPRLVRQGHHVAVIDLDPERVEALVSQEKVEGFLASEPLMDNLRQAGVTNADAFLALTDNDNRNAMAAQVAQHVFHVPKVICRIDDPQRQQVYQELGMSVVSSTIALVETIDAAIKT